MKTIFFENTDENSIEKVGEILRSGGLAAIPTETVYGLAANALDGNAVKRIFEAKGRPSDNPLIVHISDFSQIYRLVKEVPKEAEALRDAFWPGPLTIILPKSDIIPDEVSAGLSTVAIRLPSHPVARAIIDAAGVPLAAPSANVSGKPSPTSAKHVLDDLNGKVEAIIDGGICNVGVESTVITLATPYPRLLRPGGITLEQLREVLGRVDVDDAVINPLQEGKEAASPGMKYKHYSPKADVYVIDGDEEAFVSYINEKADENTIVLCYNEEAEKINAKKILIGEELDYSTQAHLLFDALRKCDELGAKTVYAHIPKKEGVSLAVYNRLMRAAGFKVINV